MKILHVSPSFYPTRAYGGTIRSSYGLCRGLTELGCAVRVLTTDTDGIGRNLEVENDRDVAVDGLQVRYCHKLFRNSVSPGLLRVLGEYVAWADVVHLIAVYSFPTFPTLVYCRKLQKPLVWSPRGSLQRWDGSTRVASKFVWERVCQMLSPKDRVVLHTTSEEEGRQSERRFPDVRTVIVHNGVELPVHIRRTEPSAELRITYLGRLHPIKGMENLLDACKLMESNSDRWRLKIAGTGEGDYPNVLKSKVEELGLQGRVEFLGEVFGEAKENLFADSDLIVAPSYVENFGMVIAEALAHEVPVIAGRGTPWEGLHANQCGLWVENDAQSLAAAIRRMRALPLREMGRRGRCWMQREFSWEAVSRQMLVAFQNCSGAPRSRTQAETVSRKTRG
jgi:glycosyltransferase involved in cell wall biosynthesis